MKAGKQEGETFVEKAGNGVARTIAFPSATWERGKIIATVLGVMTAICAVFWCFYLMSVISELWHMGSVPPFRFRRLSAFGLFLYGSPAIACTVVSSCLVGPSRCKLAWLSLCAFVPVYLIVVKLANMGIFIEDFPWFLPL